MALTTTSVDLQIIVSDINDHAPEFLLVTENDETGIDDIPILASVNEHDRVGTSLQFDTGVSVRMRDVDLVSYYEAH